MYDVDFDLEMSVGRNEKLNQKEIHNANVNDEATAN